MYLLICVCVYVGVRIQLVKVAFLFPLYVSPEIKLRWAGLVANTFNPPSLAF